MGSLTPNRISFLNLEQARRHGEGTKEHGFHPVDFKYRMTWKVLWFRERILSTLKRMHLRVRRLEVRGHCSEF